MTVLYLDTYQNKKGVKIGFSIREITKKTVTADSLALWVIGNTIIWNMLTRNSTGKTFIMSQKIFADVQINNSKTSYVISRTKSDFITSLSYEGHLYTLTERLGLGMNRGSGLQLDKAVDFIQYALTEKYRSLGPLISVPMRD